MKKLIVRATEHVIVPAAVIALVTAFLFYLLEVRSVFAGYSRAFKQVGLCFAVATVLIERYGRVQEDEVGQGTYTVLMAGATLLFMSVRSGGWKGFLLNVLVVAAVWLFASRVTRGLALNGEGRDPAVSVAWLAVLALFAFALGEPLLLGTAPEVGGRALAAVTVFLFSAAVVLAAGSSFTRLRRTEEAGGQADTGLLPVRVAIAGGLAALVLTLALALPYIRYRGSGESHKTTDRGVIGTGDNQDAPGDIMAALPRSGPGKLVDDVGPRNELPQPLPPRPRPRLSIAQRFVAFFGRWLLLLLIPLGLGALAVLILRRRAPAASLGPDPLADLSDLGRLSPRAAVLAAYGLLLRALQRLGHARRASQTPYETLDSLPGRFRRFQRPAGSLTDLYVKAAYSGETVAPEEGARAVRALLDIRERV